MDDFEEIHPMICEEFQRDASKEEAFQRICQKRGFDSPEFSIICQWFKSIHDGDSVLKNEIDEFYHSLLCEILCQYLSFNNAIFRQDNELYWTELLLKNRILFGASEHFETFEAFDTFHDKSMNLRSVFQPRSNFYPKPILVNRDQVLIGCRNLNDDIRRLYLLKVDFDAQECFIIHQIVLNESYYRVVLDSEDDTKFVLLGCDFHSLHCYAYKGHIADDKIYIEDLKLEFGVPLCFCKLEGNRFFGFQLTYDEIDEESSWYFTEYNISENLIRTVNVWSCDELSGMWDDFICTQYCWQKDKLYIAHNEVSRQPNTLIAFHAKTCEWTKTCFTGMGELSTLDIDEDGILIVNAYRYKTINGQPGKITYRLPTFKPDKLQNLAWAKIRRGTMFFGSETYENLLPNLPYNSDFRPFFESE